MSYYATVRTDVLALLPASLGEVLDVGCGRGATGAVLLDMGRALALDGIELSATAASVARRRYRSVVELDLGADRPDGSLPGVGRYDTIMANDVLEHVANPWETLRWLVAEHLRPGGRCVVSLPNVQCVEVVAPLLWGRFAYTDEGVLDRTHLRFFTRSSGRDLVCSAGLVVQHEAAVRLGHSRSPFARAVGHGLGPFGVRQLLYLAERPDSATSGAEDAPVMTTTARLHSASPSIS